MRPASRFFLHHVLAGAIVLLSPLAASAAEANSHSKFAGAYESEYKPNPTPNIPGSKPSPSMSISLGKDGTATVTQDPGTGEVTTFGHWTESGDQVTVRFDPVAGQPTPAPMVFQPGHGGLQAVTWDHVLWGKVTPPVMKRASNWHASENRHIF